MTWQFLRPKVLKVETLVCAFQGLEGQACGTPESQGRRIGTV